MSEQPEPGAATPESAPAERPARGVLTRLRIRRRRDLVLMVLALAGAAYLALDMLPNGMLYFFLKDDAQGASRRLRAASWEDPGLRCAGEIHMDGQLKRMFRAGYQAYVTRVLWDSLPPRHELFVTGFGAPQPGLQARHLLMTVELTIDGTASLTDATLAGEAGQLANARLWLAANCPAGTAAPG